jgi:hypothetical protein
MHYGHSYNYPVFVSSSPYKNTIARKGELEGKFLEGTADGVALYLFVSFTNP